MRGVHQQRRTSGRGRDGARRRCSMCGARRHCQPHIHTTLPALPVVAVQPANSSSADKPRTAAATSKPRQRPISASTTRCRSSRTRCTRCVCEAERQGAAAAPLKQRCRQSTPHRSRSRSATAGNRIHVVVALDCRPAAVAWGLAATPNQSCSIALLHLALCTPLAAAAGSAPAEFFVCCRCYCCCCWGCCCATADANCCCLCAALFQAQHNLHPLCARGCLLRQ